MWHVWETGELHPGFWWGNLSEKPTSLSEDGTIVLKWICRKRDGSLEWTDLAQDMDRLLAPENVHTHTHHIHLQLL